MTSLPFAAANCSGDFGWIEVAESAGRAGLVIFMV